MNGTVAPAVIAEAVAAAKAMLRLEGPAEDMLMTRLARTALAMGEAFCGQRLVAREFAQVLVGTGDWQGLSERPVGAIVAVEGVPVDAYAIDIAAGRGRVRLPAGTRATVRYVVGIADRWGGMPAPVAHGVVLLAVHLWENRGTDGLPPPAAIAALWRPYRVMGIGA